MRFGFVSGILCAGLFAASCTPWLLAELGQEACLYTIALEQGKRCLRDLLLDKPIEARDLKNFCETASLKGCSIANCEQVSRRPCEAISVSDIAGIVSLGSDGNVTENLPWMNDLASDLRPLLFEHKIPFYGSCFFASVAGADDGL